MKLLIKILSPSPQICEEALTLAFAMVAFEHEVQLWLGEDCVPHLFQKNSKFGKMLSSLDLYDMSPAWLSADNNSFEILEKEQINFPELNRQLTMLPKELALAAFDTVLTF